MLQQSEEVARSSSDSDNTKVLDEAIKALDAKYYFDEDEAAVDEGEASSSSSQVRPGKGKVEPSKVRTFKSQKQKGIQCYIFI